MADNKNTLTIVIAAIIFLVLGIFLGSLFVKPGIEPAESPVITEELWFVHTFSGQVTEIKDNLLLIDGDAKDPQGKPIYREAAVTPDTTIILQEREGGSAHIDKDQARASEIKTFRQICEQMQAANWEEDVSPWVLLAQSVDERGSKPAPIPTEKEITIEQIQAGDRIMVISKDNIAANIRFEVNTIYITRF